MARYRKRPVVIDAWQWLFTPEQEIPPMWITDALNTWPHEGGIAFEPDHVDGPRMLISTLEGVMTALPADWIIRGVKGELYSCKNDVFQMTYEPSEEHPVYAD